MFYRVEIEFPPETVKYNDKATKQPKFFLKEIWNIFGNPKSKHSFPYERVIFEDSSIKPYPVGTYYLAMSSVSHSPDKKYLRSDYKLLTLEELKQSMQSFFSQFSQKPQLSKESDSKQQLKTA